MNKQKHTNPESEVSNEIIASKSYSSDRGAVADNCRPVKTRVKNFESASLALWTKIVKKIGRCELCGCSWTALHAHHMIPKTGIFIKYSRDVENGICLCESCHKKAHPGWSRFSNSGLSIHELHERIKERCPKKYNWMINHKQDKRYVELDYEKIYYELKKQSEK